MDGECNNTDGFSVLKRERGNSEIERGGSSV